MKRRILIVFIALGILLAIGLPLSNILNAASLINVTTQRYNLARNAVNTQETILKTANVNVNNFGKLFSMPVLGDVYMQPLLITGVTIPGKGVHNVVYVATMDNRVYAFDADTAGPALWSVNLGVPFTANLEFNDIQGGEDGVLGTPVIDTATKTMYLVSHHDGNPPTHKIHALDITTGAEKFGGPKTINASIPGSGADADQFGHVNYDANLQLQRPGLALDNGRVFVTMGSTGDRPTFHGWMFAYSASNLSAAPIVWLASPDGYSAGIWTAGTAPTIDSNHYIYVMTGNGAFNADSGGRNYGDSIVKLKLDTTTNPPKFKVLDYFTPWNQAALDAADNDLGSSGPVLIPGTNLLFGGGKTSVLYLVNSTNMGHYICKTDPNACNDPNPDNNHDTNIVQEWNGKLSHLHNTPNIWTAPNGNVLAYIFAEQDYLKAFRFVNGSFNTIPVSTASFKNNGMPSGVATVSSNGTTTGTGIIWSTDYASHFRAVDATDLTKILWTDSDNVTRDKLSHPSAKFVVPVVANGKVYVATRSGATAPGSAASVDVYGLLPPPPTGGQLSGTLEHPVTETSVNLTAEGTSDWAHWGLNNNTSFDHKSTGNGQISNIITTGTGPLQYPNNFTHFTWSDGTPTANVPDTQTGAYTFDGGSGASFRFSVPADTTLRVLKVYVGMWNAQGTLKATLSDRSAPSDYASSFQSPTVNGVPQNDYGIYTITYKAASAGQFLTVTWTLTGGTGNLTIQAASLAQSTTPPTATKTPTKTATATNTPTSTNTPTNTATGSPQPTFQPPTNTPVSSIIPSQTHAPTVGPSPTAAPPNAFRVQYKAINVRTTENQIRAGFNIVNLTNNPANLSEFEIRYYFTRDTNDNSVTLPVACEFAVVGCAGVSLNVQPVIPAVNGVDSYLSVTFGSNNLPAGGSSGAVQIDVVKSDSSPFDQTNDFSFNATMMTYTESRHIALFRNGVLLWGTDPTLGAATLQAPTNGASNQPSHPVFQWSSVSSASRYQLRINNAGNSPVFQQWYNASDVCSGATCSVTPNVTLPNNTYSWWIETGTPAQNGPWSAGWSFRVGL